MNVGMDAAIVLCHARLCTDVALGAGPGDHGLGEDR